MRWIFFLALAGCPENNPSPVDAGYDCDPGSMCGTCDCDETTDYPTCRTCPIGKPDGGV